MFTSYVSCGQWNAFSRWLAGVSRVSWGTEGIHRPSAMHSRCYRKWVHADSPTQNNGYSTLCFNPGTDSQTFCGVPCYVSPERESRTPYPPPWNPFLYVKPRRVCLSSLLTVGHLLVHVLVTTHPARSQSPSELPDLWRGMYSLLSGPLSMNSAGSNFVFFPPLSTCSLDLYLYN